jgi:hypothetical protein
VLNFGPSKRVRPWCFHLYNIESPVEKDISCQIQLFPFLDLENDISTFILLLQPIVQSLTWVRFKMKMPWYEAKALGSGVVQSLTWVRFKIRKIFLRSSNGDV